jgi:hypothetical protein
MLKMPNSSKVLQKLFLKQPVVDMNTLSQILQTKSRMSIFRRLKEMKYFSSYTHAGRYYTLRNIPQFNEDGLWFYQEIGFSRFETLKATIVELVSGSSIGFSHLELSQLLRVKVHNSLLDLVKEGMLDRERLEKGFIYVASERSKATDQINRRSAATVERSVQVAMVSDTTVIEVLIETIHAGRIQISPSLVAKRLSKRGISVACKQIEQIFRQYGISTEKKTS